MEGSENDKSDVTLKPSQRSEQKELPFSISKILENNEPKYTAQQSDRETLPSPELSSPCSLFSFGNASETVNGATQSLYNEWISPNVLYTDVLFSEISRRLCGSQIMPVRRIGHPFQTRAPPKHKKPRTSFTKVQICELEKRFVDQKYLASSERTSLATTLNMTDSQVKTWFQNRRTKWRRKTAEERERERQQTLKLFACTGNSSYLGSNFNSTLTIRPDVKL